MSKIKLEVPFQQFRGKVCKHSQIIFKEMYGTRFTSQICNPYKGAPSEAQTTHRQKFRDTTAAVQTALSDPQQRAALQAEFAKQRKYRTLYGYAFAQQFKKP